MSKTELIDKDFGFRDLMKRAQAIKGTAFVKVGVLSDSERGGLHRKEADGKASPLTVAEIALVNEFGTKDGRIPSRPAIRDTFDAMREDLEKMGARLLVLMIVDGTMTADRALDLMGLKLATEIRKHIVAGVTPVNAAGTMARKLAKSAKGRAKANLVKPLIDTARMLNAIAWARVFGESQAEANYIPGSREV